MGREAHSAVPEPGGGRCRRVSSQDGRRKRYRMMEGRRCCLRLRPCPFSEFRNDFSLRSTCLVSLFFSLHPASPNHRLPSVPSGGVAARLPPTAPSHPPPLSPATQEESVSLLSTSRLAQRRVTLPLDTWRSKQFRLSRS